MPWKRAEEYNGEGGGGMNRGSNGRGRGMREQGR